MWLKYFSEMLENPKAFKPYKGYESRNKLKDINTEETPKLM